MDTIARYNATEHYGFAGVTHANDADHRDETTRATKAKTTIITGDFGAGWYHDAAIKDANEALAHPYR